MNFRESVCRFLGCASHRWSSDHYRELMERHLHNSNFYQGLLYHAWKCNKKQTKGLQRQARKIKRLQKLLSDAMSVKS